MSIVDHIFNDKIHCSVSAVIGSWVQCHGLGEQWCWSWWKNTQ